MQAAAYLADATRRPVRRWPSTSGPHNERLGALLGRDLSHWR